MRKRALYLGLLILVAVVALAAAMVRLHGSRGPVFYAELRTASGLRDGAAVSFRGVPVGRVTDLAVATNAVRVTIALNRSDVPLYRGDGARVRRAGMLGEVEVELVPTPTPGPALRGGELLPEVAPDPVSVRREAAARAWFRLIGKTAGVTMGSDSGVGGKAVP